MIKLVFPYSITLNFLGMICLISLSSCVNDSGSRILKQDYHESQRDKTQGPSYFSEGREEIALRQTPSVESALAQNDPYKLRSWNWDYKETWREDKDVFYRGGTQTNAMQRDFRYVRPPGVGDPDDIYWESHDFYRRPLFDQEFPNP